MLFEKFVQESQKHFPDLKIKYKNESFFMKLLGHFLFFNKNFMTSYTTTIGSTVYYPNSSTVNSHPISNIVVLLHELVHINDAKKIGKLIFGFLYLCPQILLLILLPLLFISWKLIFLILIFSLPIPAYFRMLFEKRAYLSSLYSLYNLGKKYNFDPKLETQKNFFLDQFSNSYYYFMWPFSNIKKEFNQAIININNNQKPYKDPVFDIIDNIINNSNL